MAANPTTTATLELNAVDNVSSVTRTVKSGVNDLIGVYDKLKLSMGALAAVAGVGFFTDMIRGAIAAQGEMLQLAQRTGTTVEALSSLKGVAKLSETSMEDVGKAMQKLSKAMLEAETGGGKQAKVFDALGITVRDATTGGLRPAQEVLQDVAIKLANMQDKTLAVAFAQELLGKAGANLMPFLIELANTGQLTAKMSTANAEEAKKFEDSLVKLESGSKKLGITLANALLPHLNSILDGLLKLKNGGPGANVLPDYTWFDRMIATISEKFNELVLVAQRGKQRFWEAMPFSSGAAAMAAKETADAEARVANVRARMRAGEASNLAAGFWDTDAPRPVTKVKNIFDTPGAATGPDYSELFARTEARIAASKELEAMLKLEADAAAKAAAEAEKLNKAYEDQAERYKQLIDPTRTYYQQMVQVEELQRMGKLTAEEASAAMAKLQDSIDKALGKGAQEDIKAADDFARRMGLTFTSAFENAITKGKGLRDVITGIGEDIAKVIVRMSITEPVGGAISDAVKGSGLYNSLKGMFNTDTQGGAFADGGTMTPNTWNLVGEAGPEMVWSGAGGGSVVPNSALGGGDTYYIDARGADRSGLAQLAAAIRQVNGSIEARAVSAWKSYAGNRGVATV